MDSRYSRLDCQAPLLSGRCLLFTYFLICCFSIISFSTAFAETITVSGLRFEVDELAPIDRSNVEVRIGTERRVVPRKSLHDYIVKKYLLDLSRVEKFPVAALERFVETALSRGQIARSQLGLEGLLRHPRNSDSRLETLVEALEKLDGSQKLFQGVLANLQSRKDFPVSVSRMLLWTGLESPNWVRGNAIRAVYMYREDLRSLLIDNMQSALTERDQRRASQITKFVVEIFGRDDELSLKLRGTLSRASKVYEYIDTGSYEELFAQATLSRSNEEANEFLFPLISAALTEVAEEALDAGKPGRSLYVLARANLGKGTAKTRNFARESLDAIDVSKSKALQDPKIQEMLDIFSDQDERTKRSYSRAFDKQIRVMIQKGLVSQADAFLKKLLDIRPDPDQLNDAIRIELAIAYSNVDDTESARLKIAEVQTGVSISHRVSLYFSSLYRKNRRLASLLIMILSSLYLFYLVRKVDYTTIDFPKFARGRSFVDRVDAVMARFDKEPEEEFDPYGEAPRFGRVNPGLNPSKQEYITSLHKLGLSSGCSEKEIKTAYRNLVKAVHPDMNPNLNRASKERFLELTSAYEKALDLRARLAL